MSLASVYILVLKATEMNSFLLLGSIDSITLKSITNGIIQLFLIKIIS